MICSDLRPICYPLFLVPWPGPTPREQQFARHRSSQSGQGKLWAGQVTRVAKILRRYNRRTLSWGDQALKAPAFIPQLPRDMVAAIWTDNADDHFADFITPFQQAGPDVVVCPSASN